MQSMLRTAIPLSQRVRRSANGEEFLLFLGNINREMKNYEHEAHLDFPLALEFQTDLKLSVCPIHGYLKTTDPMKKAVMMTEMEFPEEVERKQAYIEFYLSHLAKKATKFTELTSLEEWNSIYFETRGLADQGRIPQTLKNAASIELATQNVDEGTAGKILYVSKHAEIGKLDPTSTLAIHITEDLHKTKETVQQAMESGASSNIIIVLETDCDFPEVKKQLNFDESISISWVIDPSSKRDEDINMIAARLNYALESMGGLEMQVAGVKIDMEYTGVHKDFDKPSKGTKWTWEIEKLEMNSRKVKTEDVRKVSGEGFTCLQALLLTEVIKKFRVKNYPFVV